MRRVWRCGAGHVTNHRLVVQHEKPIPAVVSAERRAKIERLRKDYKLKIAAAGPSVNVCIDSFDSDEELSWYDRLDKSMPCGVVGWQPGGQ